MKKLSLKNLEIKSFVTSLNDSLTNDLKAGATVYDTDCGSDDCPLLSIHISCVPKASALPCPVNYTRDLLKCVDNQP